MKERYVIELSGYVWEDPDTAEQGVVDPVLIGAFPSEEEALKKLSGLDQDSHYMEREIREHLGEGIYDWSFDDDYGTKYLWEFDVI